MPPLKVLVLLGVLKVSGEAPTGEWLESSHSQLRLGMLKPPVGVQLMESEDGVAPATTGTQTEEVTLMSPTFTAIGNGVPTTSALGVCAAEVCTAETLAFTVPGPTATLPAGSTAEVICATCGKA